MKLRLVFSFLGTLLVLFIAVPLIRVLLAVEPGEVVSGAAQKEVMSSVFLTLRASLWSTLAGIFLGIPLAFFLARVDFAGKKIIEGLVDIPIVIPHTAAGIALLMAWGRQSLFTR
ncbi:MAG: molybdenum ABC transporter permease, partial [Candidatus Aminicenantales bacterium]